MKPASYGESYIDADGNLGGLNKHTSSNYGTFLIREKLPASSLWVNLLADSTRVNEGVTLQIGSYNDIIAQGGHEGLEVQGKLSLDSTSVLHMRDGAELNFIDGSILEITVRLGENYILVADFDASSLMAGLDVLSLNVLGDPDHDWKLKLVSEEEGEEGAPAKQLILYYAVIREPSVPLLSFVGLGEFALRRNKRRYLEA